MRMKEFLKVEDLACVTCVFHRVARKCIWEDKRFKKHEGLEAFRRCVAWRHRGPAAPSKCYANRGGRRGIINKQYYKYRQKHALAQKHTFCKPQPVT